MQLLIIVAIAGIAAVFMSAGSLMPEIGWFTLQGVSVNETDFSAPLSHVNVDIDISKQTHFDETAEHSVYLNLITECSFHTPDEGGLGEGSTVICKLTDFDGDVVAEGRQNFPNGLDRSERAVIDINMVAHEFANEIQNINDFKLIVLGGDPTCGDATQGQDPCT